MERPEVLQPVHEGSELLACVQEHTAVELQVSDHQLPADADLRPVAERGQECSLQEDCADDLLPASLHLDGHRCGHGPRDSVHQRSHQQPHHQAGRRGHHLHLPTIFVTTGVWQGLGWGTILYLAAMSGINTELYEAAELDGANRFQQCLHVTIPAILPTISTLLVLNIGSLCGSAAFEKVFLLYTPTTYETADIIATYVYRMGLGSGNYSYATAVGLFQGVINLVLLTVANKVSSWLTGSGLW
uniref:ABC transporter permease subunit n=1 Tax=Gemmiger formicilis TaxID=745368 RepID=UPI0040269096